MTHKQKIIFALILCATVYAAADDIPPWAEYWTQESIHCTQINSRETFTFFSDPHKPGASEAYCRYSKKYSGDTILRLKPYMTDSESVLVAQCWREVALLQVNDAQCCFENINGKYGMPWQVCGVRGVKWKEDQATEKFIFDTMKRYNSK